MKNKDTTQLKMTLISISAIIILAVGYAIITSNSIRLKQAKENYIGEQSNTTSNDNEKNSNSNNELNNDKKSNNNNSTPKSSEEKNEKFNVNYTLQPKIIKGEGTAVIIDDKNATFNVTGMSLVGDYAEVEYTIINDSTLSACFSIKQTVSNEEYFEVKSDIRKKELLPNEKTTLKIKVELKKSPLDVVTTTIKEEIIATPNKK